MINLPTYDLMMQFVPSPENPFIALVFLFYLIVILIAISMEKIDKTIIALAGGGLAVLFATLMGLTSSGAVLGFIDLSLLIVMLGTMIVIEVCKETGVFQYLTVQILRLTKGDPIKLLIYLNLLITFFAAIMADITAMLIVGSLTVSVTHILDYDAKPYLLCETILTNVGGLATLVSSIPNILIGTQLGIGYIEYVIFSLPLLVALTGASLMVMFFEFRPHLKQQINARSQISVEYIMDMDPNNMITDRKVAYQSLLVLGAMIVGFVISDTIHVGLDIVAILAAAAAMLINQSKTDRIIKSADWPLVAFFIGIFLLLGVLQEVGTVLLLAGGMLSVIGQNFLISPILFMWLVSGMSILVDNISLTTLLIPIIQELGTAGLLSVHSMKWALLLGATLGGNIVPIGSAENLVTIGLLKEAGGSVTIKEFTKFSTKYVLLQLSISMLYLALKILFAVGVGF